MAARNSRVIDCAPGDVFATLADGWLYPVWVVGAARMRAVSVDWPEPGARLHHSLGLWPVLVDDETEIVEWSPPERVRLRAKAGPLGRAVVVIDVRERGSGCIARITEEPVSGPALLIPRALWSPVLRARNRETLRRLAYLSEGRRRERDSGERTARPDVPPDKGGRGHAGAERDVAAAPEASAAPPSSSGPSADEK